VIAVAAIELYRSELMSDFGSESGHFWGWYFGAFDLRLSKEFWLVVVARFNGWQPPQFLAVFLGVALLSFILARDVRASTAFIAAIIGVLSGWLVFANIYEIHDYYQLPSAIIVFLAFAIILGCLIESTSAKGWMSSRSIYIIKTMTLTTFLYQAVAADTLNQKERVNFWAAVEYLLRDDTMFLYVADNTDSPAIGGYVTTKFEKISPASLEVNCSKYLVSFKAVLLEGNESACLESAKARAKHFISDDHKLFVYLANP
jgi:hypothetical protein